MANKTPIRAVFNDAGTATGLSEFQTGDTVGLTHGGLGASLSIGSAGQVLKVNSGASALEFGSVEAVLNIDGMTDGSSITIADTDKFAISDGGTEKFVTATQISDYVNAELGLDIDSYSDGTGITLAATDKFVVSDGGTEKKLNASQIDTFVSGTSSTLTNKTLTAPTINGVVGGTATSQTITTLTTSTIANGGSNAITLSGANVTIAGNLSVSGSTTTVDSTTVSIQNAFVFEGATADAHETTLTTVDPTADRTISLPNVSGTLPVLAAASTTQITSTPEELNILDGVTSTAAELNILDGVTSTATELNIIDGDTSAGTTAFASGDGLVTNDNGTMRQTTVATLDTFLAATTKTLTNKSIDSDNNTITNIVNADIKSSAAIAFSKMADLTTGRALVSDGSGDVSVSAVTSTEIGHLDGVSSNIQTQLDAKTTQAFAIAIAMAL
tara:strand:+ start:20058 stop:21389 length:1332 start_codon:yes stop_codon:yes gene_type:complete